MTTTGCLMLGTSTDSFSTRIITATRSTMANGDSIYFTLGQSNSGNNQGEISFYYGSNASNTNRIDFGFFGSQRIFTIRGNDCVGIRNVSPVYPLDFGSSAANMFINFSSGTYGIGANNNCLQSFSSDHFTWHRATSAITSGTGTQIMRLTSNATLLIGAATTAANSSNFLEVAASNNYSAGFAGWVGIGIMTPSYPLHINLSNGASINATYAVVAPNLALTTITATAVSISLYTVGRIYCGNELNVGSDRRIKREINSIELDYCERFVRQTNPVRYKYMDDETLQQGFIAQDLIGAGLDKGVVNFIENKDLHENFDEESGVMNPEGVQFTIAYDKIVPLLSGALKVAYKKIDDLEARLARLESLLN
jgi:hypothetical protein